MPPVKGFDKQRLLVKKLQWMRFDDANSAADYVFERLGEPALKALRPRVKIPNPRDGAAVNQRYRDRVIRLLREKGIGEEVRHQRLADSPPTWWGGQRVKTKLLVEQLERLLKARAKLRYESAQLHLHYYTTASSLSRLVIWRRIVYHRLVRLPPHHHSSYPH